MIVYWSERNGDNLQAFAREFSESSTQINELLDYCAELRREGKLFVTSTGEGMGASIVKDGKLPNGQPYTWKKRRL
jgi:hypothetical protein